MKKDISARLAEKLAHSDSQHAKRNLAIFFVLRDEINSAINTGWSVKDIWQLLHDEKKIVISYQVFLRLVKKHTEYTAFKRKGSSKRISKENELEPKTETKETKAEAIFINHSSIISKETIPTEVNEDAAIFTNSILLNLFAKISACFS